MELNYPKMANSLVFKTRQNGLLVTLQVKTGLDVYGGLSEVHEFQKIMNHSLLWIIVDLEEFSSSKKPRTKSYLPQSISIEN